LARGPPAATILLTPVLARDANRRLRFRLSPPWVRFTLLRLTIRPAQKMFITFDGIDGVGKSTQLKLLCDWLAQRGRPVVACRDPGSTPLGESVRKLLLDRHDLQISRPAEMLLYMAARAQLVEQVIRPALAAGQSVVSDRFLLANVVYQGHAGGLDVNAIWEVGRVATGGIEPDLTILLDMDPQAATDRIRREPDRMESQGADFRRRLRDGFLAEAARRPDQIRTIDAARPVDAVQAEIRRIVAQKIQATEGTEDTEKKRGRG